MASTTLAEISRKDILIMGQDLIKPSCLGLLTYVLMYVFSKIQDHDNEDKMPKER